MFIQIHEAYIPITVREKVQTIKWPRPPPAIWVQDFRNEEQLSNNHTDRECCYTEYQHGCESVKTITTDIPNRKICGHSTLGNNMKQLAVYTQEWKCATSNTDNMSCYRRPAALVITRAALKQRDTRVVKSGGIHVQLKVPVLLYWISALMGHLSSNQMTRSELAVV